MRSSKIIVNEAGESQRLDQWLAQVRPETTRSGWQKSIRLGLVRINGVATKAGETLSYGDEVTISAAAAEVNTEAVVDIPILYQDDNVIVVNKPAGVLSHPTPKKPAAFSVATALQDLIDDPDPLRPGIVHRLDRDTSGVMIVARTVATKAFLQQQFKARQVKKAYLALAQGKLEHSTARIELPIGRHSSSPAQMSVSNKGKMAVSTYRLRQQYDNYSLLELDIMTGRMHQIRVHLAHLGHPVVGDPIYNRAPRPAGLERMFLHAGMLEIAIAENTTKHFEAPLPSDLERFLHQL